MDIYEKVSVNSFIKIDNFYGNINGWRYLSDAHDAMLAMLMCRNNSAIPTYLFDAGCGYNPLSFQIANCCDGNYEQITLVDPRFKNKPLRENMGAAVYPTNVKKVKTITRPLPGAVYSIKDTTPKSVATMGVLASIINYISPRTFHDILSIPNCTELAIINSDRSDINMRHPYALSKPQEIITTCLNHGFVPVDLMADDDQLIGHFMREP